MASLLARLHQFQIGDGHQAARAAGERLVREGDIDPRNAEAISFPKAHTNDLTRM